MILLYADSVSNKNNFIRCPTIQQLRDKMFILYKKKNIIDFTEQYNIVYTWRKNHQAMSDFYYVKLRILPMIFQSRFLKIARTDGWINGPRDLLNFKKKRLIFLFPLLFTNSENNFASIHLSNDYLIKWSVFHMKQIKILSI